jgi:hypothetical protein
LVERINGVEDLEFDTGVELGIGVELDSGVGVGVDVIEEIVGVVEDFEEDVRDDVEGMVDDIIELEANDESAGDLRNNVTTVVDFFIGSGGRR